MPKNTLEEKEARKIAMRRAAWKKYEELNRHRDNKEVKKYSDQYYAKNRDRILMKMKNKRSNMVNDCIIVQTGNFRISWD